MHSHGYAAVDAKPARGEIEGPGFAVELDFLEGRAKLPEYDVFSLLH